VEGAPIAQEGAGGAPDCALHVDALGSVRRWRSSVRALSDGTGAVVGSRQDAASGAPRSPSGRTPDSASPASGRTRRWGWSPSGGAGTMLQGYDPSGGY